MTLDGTSQRPGLRPQGAAPVTVNKRGSLGHPASHDDRYACANGALTIYEQPLVVPQLSHFRHVPLRTSVNWPHCVQASPA
jgi:hypothetical protein